MEVARNRPNDRGHDTVVFDRILSSAINIAEGRVIGTEEVFVGCAFQMSAPFGDGLVGDTIWSILRMERMREGLDEISPA